MVFSFSVGQQDAARRVLRHFAHMESDATALWYILHNGQETTELGGHGDGEVIAQRRDLIADALEGVTEPTAVDDKATSDGGAIGLITKQLYVHDFLGGYFKTIIVNLDVNFCQFKESILLLLIMGNSLPDEQ